MFIFIVFMIFYGCQNNNEITTCNVSVTNNIGYVDGKVYSGTCNIFYNDSILWKQRTYKRGKVKEIGYFLPGRIEYKDKKDGYSR